MNLEGRVAEERPNIARIADDVDLAVEPAGVGGLLVFGSRRSS